jgi:hypothetical protein
MESSSEDEHQKVINKKAGKYRPDEVFKPFKSKLINNGNGAGGGSEVASNASPVLSPYKSRDK